MALALENANLVWQKAKAALVDADPSIQNAFLDLKMQLATSKGNPNLQFIGFSEAQAIANNGADLVSAACTLYGVYVKGTRVTGTTSAFFAIHAAADNTATTTTIFTSRLKAIGQYFAGLFPKGLASETGLTVSFATAVGGATESTTPDGGNGFVIVGAA